MLSSHLQPSLQRQRWPFSYLIARDAFPSGLFLNPCNSIRSLLCQGVLQLSWVMSEDLPPLVGFASTRGFLLCPRNYMLLDS